MIRCLRGEVLNVVENAVLLDVHGMGFDVLCSRGALALCRAGERVREVEIGRASCRERV